MRIKVLLKINVLILCLFVFCGCKRSENSLLDFEGINGTYSVNDAIAFSLKNLSSSRIVYKVSVQVKREGNWLEGVSDIESTDYDKRVLFMDTLNPGEIKTHLWPTKSTPPLYKPAAGKFRFVVTCVSDPKNTYFNWLTPTAVHETFQNQYVYSREFEIK